MKYAERAARAQHGKSLGVIERDSAVINIDAVDLFGDVGGFLQDRHGLEAKEIHFQQAAFFNLRHVELRRRLVFDFTYRHVIPHWPGRDDHAACMDAQ